jgi:hypothetical protein
MDYHQASDEEVDELNRETEGNYEESSNHQRNSSQKLLKLNEVQSQGVS